MTISKPHVTIISKLTVVSSTPVKPGKSYPLSVLDHSMGLHTLHIIFYYPLNGFVNIESFDLSNLRDSLAETLSHYPPVTGRLMKDETGNWEIKCNDAGVRVVKARVDCSLDEWLRTAGGEEEKGLAVWEEMPEDTKAWSPFQIQINEFVGGGIAIGLSCPHMHADPACATLLMKSWTDLYRKSCISQPPFFHPPALRARTTPNTMTEAVKNYEAMSSLNRPMVKMSTATFLFSDTMIKKLLSEVKSKCPDATPFEMLAALFWSSINNAKTPLSICFNFRKHMHAPLPYGFFGNALHFTKVSTDGKKTEAGGLDHLTEIVHDHLSSIDEEAYWSVIDWFDSKNEETGKYAAPFKMYGTELTCMNMENVSPYAAVIEDVKPPHVSYHIGNVEGEGVILVLPSPEEGLGRIVTVTLPEYQTDKLRSNPAILRLEPTMIVSGR